MSDDIKDAIGKVSAKLDTVLEKQAESNVRLEVLVSDVATINQRGCAKGADRISGLRDDMDKKISYAHKRIDTHKLVAAVALAGGAIIGAVMKLFKGG